MLSSISVDVRCARMASNTGANVPVTSAQLYSASKTQDLESALLLLSRMYPHAPMIGLGFSLGGAILAKHMGEAGERTPFIGAVCVGAPFKLDQTCVALESSYLTMAYSYAMGQNLMNVLKRHVNTLALLPSLWEPLEVAFGQKIKPNNNDPLPQPNKSGPRRGTLRFVDHYLVRLLGGYSAPYGEFPFESAEAYYNYGSSTNFMGNVARPLLAVNADDDPIVPLKTLSVLRGELEKNKNIVLAHTERGGHLGWFASASATRWINEPIAEFIAALFSEFEKRDGKCPTAGLGSGGPKVSQHNNETVKKQNVQVELLPARALPGIFSDTSPEYSQTFNTPNAASEEPMHAWLLTQVLQHVPLVHPQHSPVRLAEENPKSFAEGKKVELTLVR